jgi:hypothetical protein
LLETYNIVWRRLPSLFNSTVGRVTLSDAAAAAVVVVVVVVCCS